MYISKLNSDPNSFYVVALSLCTLIRSFTEEPSLVAQCNSFHLHDRKYRYRVKNVHHVALIE